MTEQELFKIWKSPENQERLEKEQIQLVTDVKTDLKRFNLFVDNRDLVSIAGSIMAILFMLFGAYGSSLLQSKIVQIAISVWSLLLIINVLIARRSKPAPISESYFQYLIKSSRYLHHQKRLYDLVVYWSILPFVILMLFYFWAPVIWKEPTISKSVVAVVFSVICLLAGVRVYRKSKHEFNNEVRPRIERVDQLIKVIENQTS